MTSIDVIERRTDWACDIMPVLPWLKSLPSGKVHCWVTSPPYFGLRSYLPKDHPDKVHEIGTEATPAEFVDKMVALFGEAHRALHDSGVLWLNLGDCYNAAGRTGRGTRVGYKQSTNRASAAGVDFNRPSDPNLKPKDLMGVPWLVAFAMREAGWYLRQWMPWVKRNPMTESVEDRPVSACESIFLLSKSANYFYDFVAVRRADAGYDQGNRDGYDREARITGGGKDRRGSPTPYAAGSGRNLRNNDLWFDSVGLLLNDNGDPLGLDSNVGNFKGSHFASFPRQLIEPLILCGSSEKGVCPDCGSPWERQFERERVATRPGNETKVGRVSDDENSPYQGHGGSVVGNRDPQRHCTKFTTTGWEPTCKCGKAAVPAVVGDMFAGTGQTLAVTREHGRVAIGCDIDARNLEFIHKRMTNVTPNLMTQFLGGGLEDGSAAGTT